MSLAYLWVISRWAFFMPTSFVAVFFVVLFYGFRLCCRVTFDLIGVELWNINILNMPKSIAYNYSSWKLFAEVRRRWL